MIERSDGLGGGLEGLFELQDDLLFFGEDGLLFLK
jgi:hypothetical protein